MNVLFNLFEGKSIINISISIIIYGKITYTQVFAYEHKLAPYFLFRAVFYKDKIEKLKWITVYLFSILHITTDKIEKLKWITVYLFSILHITIIQIQSFKSALGEAFQCKTAYLLLYIENTLSEPLVYNFYGFDENSYIVFGNWVSFNLYKL